MALEWRNRPGVRTSALALVVGLMAVTLPVRVAAEDDLGSLEPGKLADLVVLERSPLQDIRNTNTFRLVMKNGELYDGDTLDRLWPTEKKLEPLWWWDDGPAPATAAAP